MSRHRVFAFWQRQTGLLVAGRPAAGREPCWSHRVPERPARQRKNEIIDWKSRKKYISCYIRKSCSVLRWIHCHCAFDSLSDFLSLSQGTDSGFPLFLWVHPEQREQFLNSYRSTCSMYFNMNLTYIFNDSGFGDRKNPGTLPSALILMRFSFTTWSHFEFEILSWFFKKLQWVK
jgi:hypothetical protein